MPVHPAGRLMGYQLVGAALQPHWAGALQPRDQLVLVAMCHQALDESDGGLPPRTFWGGTSLLMLATLGHEFKPGDAGYGAAREGIRRSLRRLELAGAVRRIKTAANGRRAEYELTVWAPPLPVDNPRIDASASPTNDQSGPLPGGPQGHSQVALRATPRWPSGPLPGGPIRDRTGDKTSD